MKIVHLTPEYYGKWDDFINTIKESTFYHQTSWFEILDKVFGYKQVGFIQMEGDKIIGGLPLFKVRRLFSNHLISSPFRDRGGVICTEKTDYGHLLEYAINYSKIRSNYLLIKQMDELHHCIDLNIQIKKTSDWITTRLELKNNSNRIWRKLKNNAQGPVKQARRRGVIVRVAESSSDIDIFYKIFLINRSKLGIPAFPVTLFKKLWDSMQHKNKIRLFIAETNKKALAGILLLLHHDIVIDGYAASLPEYRNYRANDLLVWESIKWACDNGYNYFDFGADSIHQKSLLAFKKKWGGVQKNVHYYHCLSKSENFPDIDSSSKKYIIFRKILSLLPLPVFKFLSKAVVARFG